MTNKSISIQFDQEFLKENSFISENIIHHFVGKPKSYQVSPDYKLTHYSKEPLTPRMFLEQLKSIAAEINPC